MKCLILSILILSMTVCAFSQSADDQTLISGTFNNTGIKEFLDQLSKKTHYRLFYDTAHLDSVSISLTVNRQPLEKVLEMAFANSNVHYSIDSHNHVFVSQGLGVETSLPKGVVDRVTHSASVADQDSESNPNQELIRKAGTGQADNQLYVVGNKTAAFSKQPATVTGYIRDSKNGEPVIAAAVQVENTNVAALTDQYGYYSLAILPGKYMLNIQSIGMRDTRRQILVFGNGSLNMEMISQVTTLKKVIVSARKASNIKGLQMGVQRIDIKTIKQVPVVFGEADLLRVVLTMPGVKSVGEASTGLNIRGGAADQNLILFNDATIYNPSHFFGMFSAFNPEVVKDVELYKSSIPAKYGGRLSSVLEVNSREGNKKEFAGSAGIGLLTSRLNLEGPIKKNKSSFIIGGRTTYANWLLNLLPDQYKQSKASFYDINLNTSHQLGKKDNLYITGYLSKDRFNLNNDTTYAYGNENISAKWKHQYNSKLYSLITTGYDRYQYSISSSANPVNAYKLSFNVNQTYFKTHFNYFVNSSQTVEFGLNTLLYKLHPGLYQPVGSSSLVVPDQVQAEQALESALYASDRYYLSSALLVEGGVRYSLYNYLGPQTINNYPAGLPRTADDITGTTTYASGKNIKTYSGPEFRLSGRYTLTENSSVKAAFNSQRQYIHSISNTTAIAPTDIWKLSDVYIKPQFGEQYSVGYYQNLKSNTIEISAELYYKNIRDYLDYKSGAILVMNHHLETDVINTRGKAYGFELLIKKLTGKLNGWISYTYSRTLLKQDDPLAGETINEGHYYPANYDMPQSLTAITNYRVSHRFSLSLNGTYSTGRPITLPIGKFLYQGTERTLYSDRNAYRIPDYFRMDFSMNIEGNHKVHQLTHNSWTIGVYNLTGRKNPFSVYYISENGVINGYKLSIFGSAIPYINFNIRF